MVSQTMVAFNELHATSPPRTVTKKYRPRAQHRLWQDPSVTDRSLRRGAERARASIA
jgi:hypothetical protein